MCLKTSLRDETVKGEKNLSLKHMKPSFTQAKWKGWKDNKKCFLSVDNFFVSFAAKLFTFVWKGSTPLRYGSTF